MGKIIPVTVAFLLKLFNIHIFKEDKSQGCEPLISSLIFLVALFIFFTKLRFYPDSFRKLTGIYAIIWDFLFAAFFMECAMDYFWTPLELNVIKLLSNIADFEMKVLSTGYLQLIRLEVPGVIASYGLSLFFLVVALHATRYIDLRCGPALPWRTICKIKSRFLRTIGAERSSRSHRVRSCNCRKCTDYESDDDSLSDECY